MINTAIDTCIEVYKTNITNKWVATRIIARLHIDFPDYQGNFDLEDADKILRILAKKGNCIDSEKVREFVADLGYEIEVLKE
jgi:hypothetical protein